MAKPRELFNTPAPQAMSQMGQGIADAYANVGRIEGQGYAALGEGIAKGITSAASSVAGAYGDYKKMQSQIKSSEGFYNTLKEGGYLPPELAKGIDTTVNSDAYKNMGTAEKAQFWNQATNFTGNAIGQYFAMQKMQKDFGYDMAKLDASNKNAISLVGLQALLGNKTYQPTPGTTVAPYSNTLSNPRRLQIGNVSAEEEQWGK